MDLLWQLTICALCIFSASGLLLGSYFLYKRFKAHNHESNTIEPANNFLNFDTASDYSLI